MPGSNADATIGRATSSTYGLTAANLRWSKGGKPIIPPVVPVGTSGISAEVVNAFTAPEFFFIRRRRSLWAYLFFRRAAHPLMLRAAGGGGGVVRSEPCAVGAVRSKASMRYVFDLGPGSPESEELHVTPHTHVELTSGVRVTPEGKLALGEGLVPAAAGVSLGFDAERSRTSAYDFTSGVDPPVEVSLLVPSAHPEDDELTHFATEAALAEIGDVGEDEETRVETDVRRFIGRLAELYTASPAEIAIVDETRFELGEGERRTIAVRFVHRTPGVGLFALKVVADDPELDESISISDPTLYLVEDDKITLYHAVVDSRPDAAGEAVRLPFPEWTPSGGLGATWQGGFEYGRGDVAPGAGDIRVDDDTLEVEATD